MSYIAVFLRTPDGQNSMLGIGLESVSGTRWEGNWTGLPAWENDQWPGGGYVPALGGPFVLGDWYRLTCPAGVFDFQHSGENGNQLMPEMIGKGPLNGVASVDYYGAVVPPPPPKPKRSKAVNWKARFAWGEVSLPMGTTFDLGNLASFNVGQFSESPETIAPMAGPYLVDIYGYGADGKPANIPAGTYSFEEQVLQGMSAWGVQIISDGLSNHYRFQRYDARTFWESLVNGGAGKSMPPKADYSIPDGLGRVFSVVLVEFVPGVDPPDETPEEPLYPLDGGGGGLPAEAPFIPPYQPGGSAPWYPPIPVTPADPTVCECSVWYAGIWDALLKINWNLKGQASTFISDFNLFRADVRVIAEQMQFIGIQLNQLVVIGEQLGDINVSLAALDDVADHLQTIIDLAESGQFSPLHNIVAEYDGHVFDHAENYEYEED